MSCILNLLFKHKQIVNCERNVYLTRWYLLRTAPLGVFLHRFNRSDEGRELHDHPWNFLTIILWRGYNEVTPTATKCDWCNGSGTELETHTWECSNCKGRGILDATRSSRKWPGMICWRPAEWRHRVELVNGKPPWTLVIRFRERRDWGFWKQGVFTKWNIWWQRNCE